MSIKNNTISLQEVLDIINNLPEASSGSVELPELANPANAADILAGKEAINAAGKKIIGIIPTQTATAYTPTTTNQTISAGIYLTGVQTIKGDSNLISENIKSGVSIFGVVGTILSAEEVEY